MRYHIYNCNEFCEDDDFMTYVGGVEYGEAGKDARIRIIVGWLLEQVMKGSIYIPYFIEVSIQEHFKKEIDLKNPEAFVDEVDEAEFKAVIGRIMASEFLMKTFYTRWTEEETLPIVIVSDEDVSAEFILKRFPPVEYYAHVREKWEGEDSANQE